MGEKKVGVYKERHSNYKTKEVKYFLLVDGKKHWVYGKNKKLEETPLNGKVNLDEL